MQFSSHLVTTLNQAINCHQCGLMLPLRLAQVNEEASPWLCVECGEHHLAVYLPDAPREIATNALRSKRVEHGQPLATQSMAVSPGAPTPARTAPECREHSEVSRAIDRAIADGQNLQVVCQGQPFSQGIARHATAPYSPEEELHQRRQHDASTRQVDDLIASLERGESIDGGAHEAITRDALKQATGDLDLFVRLGINPLGDGYPGRHSLHVAMLAAAVGATLGWDEQTLVELGVGCLLHDLGMLLVPDKVYQTPGVLTDGDFCSIVSHPLKTFDLIEEHASAVPLTSRMVAYQVHERLNGAGYPRKRKTALIHEAAKVAAVADVYIALVSPRPHRAGLMPYHAIEHLLHAARAGEFDTTAFRALLKTISLFPIGSCLELADGRVARVLRTSPDDYSRPVVEAWRAGELDAPPEIVNLTHESKLGISRPLASLTAA